MATKTREEKTERAERTTAGVEGSESKIGQEHELHMHTSTSARIDFPLRTFGASKVQFSSVIMMTKAPSLVAHDDENLDTSHAGTGDKTPVGKRACTPASSLSYDSIPIRR